MRRRAWPWLLLVTYAFAAPALADADRKLTIRSLSASEGAGSFYLEAKLRAPDHEGGEGDGEDYEYSHRAKSLEFDAVELYRFVKVRPSVTFTVSVKPNGFLLVGDFKPDTEYNVTFSSGLKSLDGHELAKTDSRKVRTGSFKSRFSFKTRARYVPPEFQGAIPWEAVNIDDVEFVVRQVYPQNLHQWLTTGGDASQWISDEIATSTQVIKAKKNAKGTGVFSLADVAPLGQGVFVIQAREPAPPSDDTVGPQPPAAEARRGRRRKRRSHYGAGHVFDTTSVVVSNISVIAKLAEAHQLRVWTVNTTDLSPMGGVEVELISESNRRIDACSTSGTSGCTIEWPAANKALPYALVLRSGKDSTFVRIADVSLRNDPYHAGTRDFTADEGGFDAFVYSGRDLYRPGETANLAVQVRNKAFEAVPNLPVRWRITSPRGKIVREAVSETSALGVAQLDFLTSAASDTGKYVAEVAAGAKPLHTFEFLVEEFVPERIALKVTPKQEQVIGKTSASFGLSALYLFGPPVAGGAYSVSCTLKPAFSQIPKNADWFTGTYSKEDKKPINLDVVTGKLDAHGDGSAECAFGGKVNGKLTEVYELRAKADVTEAGSGRATSKTGTALVASTDAILGLKAEESKDRTVRVRGAMFSLKGERKSRGGSIKLHLFKITKNWYYSYGEGEYGENWKVDEVIAPTGVEKSVPLDASGGFEASLEAPQGWGEWLVRAIDPKTGYIADLNVGYLGSWWEEGGGPVGGANARPPEPSELKIELSATEVSPKESVKVRVIAPFTGRLLVSLEGAKVLESRWIDVAQAGPVEVELSIPDAPPNVYVTALLLKQPKEPGSKRFVPARAWGAKSVKVIPGKYQLQVKLGHPEVIESRKEMTITISNDQKAAAEYSVAVVDEGILQMTGFKSPSPIERFFDPRRLGVTSLETLGWTFAQSGKETPGGDEGGAGATNKSMPVKLVSFWYPLVKSDESGNATVKVPLPGFQGKVRVMVVASTKTRVGAASSFTTVRDPLVLQPTLPRFLSEGDKLQFPIAVTNLSGGPQKVTVTAETDALVSLTGGAQTVQIPNGQQKVLTFSAQVTGTVGTTHVKVSAATGDGKHKAFDEFYLPVRPAGNERTLRFTYDAKQEVDVAKLIPADWRKEYVRIEAMVSAMPYLTQLSHLGDLIHYPYGCIEQTTSSTMPLLVVGDILKWADPKAKENDELKDMVNSGIQRVLGMQTSSGGFGYWPGAGTPDLWGTAYGTNMLLEAKRLGYDVPQGALDNALSYLETEARNVRYQATSWNHYSHSDAVPFAIFVLAKAGKAVTEELRSAAKSATPNQWGKPGFKWGGITAENYFLLGAAAKLLGDKETLKIIADESIFSLPFEGNGDDEHTYWSPLRSDGMRLSIMEDIWPGHASSEVLAQRIANELGRNDRYYYSTQDVAWSVLALGKRLRNFKKPDAAEMKKIGFLWNGKKQAPTGDMDGQPLYRHEGGASVASGKLKLANAPQGKGVWLYLKVTGYTKTLPPPRRGGLSIKRRFLTRDGSEVEPEKIAQGDTIVVALEIDNHTGSRLKNVAVVDRLPAGFEIENPRLGRSEALEWVKEPLKADYQDLRDDRVQVFGELKAGATEHVYYQVRAVTKGKYTAPAPFVEAMYDPATFDYDSDTPVQIGAAASDR